MLYYYMDINPFLLAMGIMPVIAILLGLSIIIFKKIYFAIAISVLLPLLFITTSMETFMVNIDAWIFWGAIYGLITYGTGILIQYLMKRI